MSDSSGQIAAGHRAVLVASRSELFVDMVSEMLLETGFIPVIWDVAEAPWLTIVRVQPCVIICDCDASATDAQRLVIDATARRIPLLLSGTTPNTLGDSALTMRQRVEWLSFPITTDSFRTVVEALVAPLATVSSEGPRFFLPE
jgi:hypothetical protein